VIENINDNELQKNELLYDTLLKRRQIRLFEKRMKTDNKMLNGRKKIGELHHYRRYIIERKKLDYLYQTGRLMAEDNLPEVIRELDIYYLITKLSLYGTALSFQRVSSKKQYDWNEFKAGITDFLKHSKYATHPVVELSATCVTLLEMRDSKTYLKLLTLLDKHAESISTHMLKSFYNTANIHCASQISLGHLEYNKKMFDLQKIMHEKNLFVEGDFIQIGQIKNMVTMACRVEEYDWAREILETNLFRSIKLIPFMTSTLAC